MLIKMIRDKSKWKKGMKIEVSESKGTELLTNGFCVRLKETAISKEEQLVKTEVEKEIEKTSEKEKTIAKAKKNAK